VPRSPRAETQVRTGPGMLQTEPVPPTVTLLADSPSAIEPVAEMRWREWGHGGDPPESVERGWWLAITRSEAGTVDLPVTFVARDDGEVLGAVGLDHYDLEERRETSPWVTGMIVRTDHRLNGVGRALMTHLERWAVAHGIDEAWVGTDLAAEFYRRCGWAELEIFTTRIGQEMTVLYKRLTP
jgi:GNAT superfamily N-acetyltransferase